MTDRRATLALTLAVASCAGGARAPTNPLVDATPIETGDDGVGRRLRELELEVLAGYDRLEAGIDPGAGLAAIGVGAEDDRTTGGMRWPVSEVDNRPSARRVQPVEVVSRSLEVHLAADQSVGWTFDQVSLHFDVCGRVASVPLRIAQVYVRDSDRWTLVAEHVGYAQPIDAAVETAPASAKPAASADDAPELAAARAILTTAFAIDGDREQSWDGGPESLAVWPDPRPVLRADALHHGVSLATAVGATRLELQGTRFALGPGGQVAIAATGIVATVDRGGASVDLRLRASAVLERRGDGPWRVRMALVSAPIATPALIARTVGVIATSVAGGRITTQCLDGPGKVARGP